MKHCFIIAEVRLNAKSHSVDYGVSTEVLTPCTRLYAALCCWLGDQEASDKPLPCASGTRSVYLMHLDTVDCIEGR